MSKNTDPNVFNLDKARKAKEAAEVKRDGDRPPRGSGRANANIQQVKTGVGKVDKSVQRRPKREDLALEAQRELIRDDLRARGKAIDEASVDEQAREIIEAHQHDAAVDKEERVDGSVRASSSHYRGRVRTKLKGARMPKSEDPYAMLAAVRNSPWGREIYEEICRSVRGRNTSHRLSAGVFELLLYMPTRAMIDHYRELNRADNLALHRALDHPWADDCGTALSSVYAAVFGDKRKHRHKNGQRVIRAGMVHRLNPDIWFRICIEIHQEIQRLAPNDDFDVYGSFDGTPLIAHRQQRQSWSEWDEALIDDGLGTRYLSHGQDKYWRGWNLQILTLTNSRTAPVWQLLGAEDQGEWESAPELMGRLFDHWPECRLRFVTGDREYDFDELCARLEFAYGVHPVFPRRAPKDVPSGLRDKGMPSGYPDCCSQLMRVVSMEDFPTREDIAAWGGRLGELVTRDGLIVPRGDGKTPRIRYVCDKCGNKKQMYPHHYPKWTTFVPHRDTHRGRPAGLFDLRSELTAWRNVSESVNAEIKYGGLGLGTYHPRWVNSAHAARHWVGASMVRMALHKLLRLNGAYQEMEDYYRSQGCYNDRPVDGVVEPPDGDAVQSDEDDDGLAGMPVVA